MANAVQVRGTEYKGWKQVQVLALALAAWGKQSQSVCGWDESVLADLSTVDTLRVEILCISYKRYYLAGDCSSPSISFVHHFSRRTVLGHVCYWVVP